MKKKTEIILAIIISIVIILMLIYAWQKEAYEVVKWALVGAGLSALYHFSKSDTGVKWTKWKEEFSRKNKKLVIILIVIALIVFGLVGVNLALSKQGKLGLPIANILHLFKNTEDTVTTEEEKLIPEDPQIDEQETVIQEEISQQELEKAKLEAEEIKTEAERLRKESETAKRLNGEARIKAEQKLQKQLKVSEFKQFVNSVYDIEQLILMAQDRTNEALIEYANNDNQTADELLEKSRRYLAAAGVKSEDLIEKAPLRYVYVPENLYQASKDLFSANIFWQEYMTSGNELVREKADFYINHALSDSGPLGKVHSFLEEYKHLIDVY